MASGSGSQVEAAQRAGRGLDSLSHLCTFIGHDRGGQGLLAAMLDAHPKAVVASSVSVFENVGATGRPRFADRAAMVDEIVKADRKAAKKGRKSVRVRPRRKPELTPQAIDGQGYRPGDEPTVIGTDTAAETARAMSADPAALDELEERSGFDLRLVHVVRNPFDNLMSMRLGAAHPTHRPVFGIYRWIAETIAAAERQRPILRVYLDDLASDPGGELTRVCDFLELEPGDEYLRSCAAIVVPPYESRNERRWRQAEVDEVDEMIEAFPWLDRYHATTRPKVAIRDADAAASSSSAVQASGSDDWQSHLDEIRTFCAFVGHTRSGHSLAGALIDAHPNAIISHHGQLFGEKETAGVLALPDRDKLLSTLLSQSEADAGSRSGQRRTREGARERYSYRVPDQWQGRFSELFVLGTQHAQDMSGALNANPASLDALRDLLGIPVKLISMVRNPWDHLESMGRGVPAERTQTRMRVLEAWLRRSRMIQLAKDRGYDVLDVALEELIANPETELRRICEFLDLEPLPDYLEACSSVVFDSPNRTQRDHDWTQEEIEATTVAIDEFPWLERYRSVEAPTGAS